MNLEDLKSSTAATITRQQAAEVLGVDPRTVTQGIADGAIPGIKIGRRTVIPREPFVAMLTVPAIAA